MESLERMDGLLRELQQQRVRLALVAKDENITAHAVMTELVETVMSFLVDVTTMSFQGQMDLRQYLHDEVEPAILSNNEDPDGLMPEDAELFQGLLLGYKSMLVASLSVEPPEGMDEADANAAKRAAAGQIARIDAALGRIEDLRLRPPDDDDDDIDDEQEDEQDGDSDGAPAAVVDLPTGHTADGSDDFDSIEDVAKKHAKPEEQPEG